MMTDQQRLELAAEFWDAPGEAYFSREHVAAFLRCPESRLLRDAALGVGIPFTKYGNRPLYQKSDVLAYLEANKRQDIQHVRTAQRQAAYA
jgi:hypothetical protein